MKMILLAVKRCLRTIYFPILMFVLALVLALAPRLSESQSHPPAGFCDLDGSAVSDRISTYLTGMGFIRCDTKAELIDGVCSGKLDCGFVLEEGFEDLLLENTLDGAVPIITSPMSYSPAIWRNHVAAAVFTELAPVISAAAVPDSVDLSDELTEEYRRIIDSGLLFSFKIETNGSVHTVSEFRSMSYVKGAAALLVFTIMMYAVCDVLKADAKPLAGRIGAWKTVLYAVLPDLAVRVFGICLALTEGVLLSGEAAVREMLPALIVFTLLCTAFAILAGAIFLDDGHVRILAFFMLVGGLVICPITFDATIILPWLTYVRLIFPPYWLWICCDEPLISALAVILLPASVATLAWRLKGMRK